MELLQSKKFQMAIVGFIVAIASKLGFTDLDDATLFAILSPFLTYIAGQGVADIGKEKVKEAAKVEAAGGRAVSGV